MTKLLLNLQTGELQIEGEEQFVKQVYEDLKNGLFTKLSSLGQHQSAVVLSGPQPTTQIKEKITLLRK